jgi:exopolysaccharide biosynthesis protein
MRARHWVSTRPVVLLGLAAVVAATVGLTSPVQAAGRGPATGQSWLPSTPALWPQVVSETRTAPETITSGVTWTQEHYQTVSGAQRAQVLKVSLDNPNIHLGMVEAGNTIVNPSDETISSMAGRTGAVAGTNADFFAIHASGSPEGMVVHDGVLEESPVATWPDDLEILNNGQVKIATETFTGTVDDTTQGSSQPLGDVNRLGISADTKLSLVTPDEGATSIGSSVVATATVAPGSAPNEPTLTVGSVSSGVTSLPTLPSGSMDLVASPGTAAATWLTGTVKPGDTLSVTEALSPYPLQQQAPGGTPYVATAVSGGADLLVNGKLGVPLQGGGENNINDPVTGLGVTKNGRHAIMAVFDGHEPENQAAGLTRPEFAEWFAQRGAYNAILFDSGGSSEMVARKPGARQVSVLNVPSDGQERDVANGLFVYSTASGPGPAVSTQGNDGQPLTMLAGTTLSVPVSATDAAGNPAAGTPKVTVKPPSAATVTGTSMAPDGTELVQLQAAASDQAGRLVVRDGTASSSEPLRVVTRLRSLSMSPGEPDIANSGTVTFALTGTGAGGGSVVVPAGSATWNATPSSLGTVSGQGVFTGAATGAGLATVTALAGGATATTTVAVGTTSQTVDSMTDVSAWALSTTNGATGSLSASADAPPGFSGSMDVHYDIPGGSGVKQVVFYPNTVNDQVGERGGAAPTAIGLWVKGGSPPAGDPLANGVLTLAEQWNQSGNASPVTFYPTGVDFNGWTFIEAQLPAGLQYPLSLNFLDLLTINPAASQVGDVELAGLQALYSPRPVVTPPYVAIPRNPGWLQYEESPADFTPGGQTVMSFDDAHFVSTDPGSTSALDLQAIKAQLPALPAPAQPQAIQTQGDMVDSGTIPNLDYLQQTLGQFGLPYHVAVGNHEITQGANPENVNFTSVFGDTHYTWTIGGTEFIVADSAHGGLTASDPYQVPAENQYPWLVQQLSQTTAKTVIVVTHEPAYDPHVVQNSQMGDRYEAQMYELLAQEFQASHPGVHLILLFGHARGFSEQLLDQYGNQVPSGIPNFVVADLGVPAYAPANQGGFYHYVLFHFLPDGTVQFAVQPILKSLAVDTPQATSLPVGGSETLTATGTSYAGDDYPAINTPVADPASHVWSSSDPFVVSVNPVSGKVTARHPGNATITVSSGTLTASVTLTVTG